MTPAELKAWRKSLRLTQAAAARELGIGISAYKDWERGISRTTGKPITPPQILDLACEALTRRLARDTIRPATE